MNRVLPILLLVISCLFPGIAHAEQSSITFNISSHDFGTIAEDGGSVSYTFTCKNNTEKPIVILSVSGGCSCTTAQYSKQPILPKRSSQIKVLFDPMNQPEGKFIRKVVVTTSEGRIPLTISGDITPRKKSIAEQYPISLTDEVRIEANSHAFGYIEHDTMIRSSIGIINISNKKVKITLTPQTKSGVLDIKYPTILNPNESGTIDFGYLIDSHKDIYGSIKDVIEIEVDNNASRYPLIINGIVIDKRENEIDKEWQKIQLSKNFIKFGNLKHVSSTVESKIEIHNIGLEPLIIRKIECSDGPFEVELVGERVIYRDQMAPLIIRVNPSKCDFGAVTSRIMVISNDPQQPVKSFRVSAIIEK